jgi:hypothetical protein
VTHLTFDEGRECLSSRAPAGDLQTGRHLDDLVTLAGRGRSGVEGRGWEWRWGWDSEQEPGKVEEKETQSCTL